MPFGTFPWMLWLEGGHTLQLNLRPCLLVLSNSLETSGCHIPFPKSFFPRLFLPFLFLSFLFVLFSDSLLLLSSPTCVYLESLFRSQPLLSYSSFSFISSLFCPSVCLILHHPRSLPPLFPVFLSPLSFLPRRPGVSLGPWTHSAASARSRASPASAQSRGCMVRSHRVKQFVRSRLPGIAPARPEEMQSEPKFLGGSGFLAPENPPAPLEAPLNPARRRSPRSHPKDNRSIRASCPASHPTPALRAPST